MGSRRITRVPATAAQWPDASNTGVPAGTSLTAYSGPSNITTNGTVIDGKTLTVGLTINANNVTIRNSKFETDGYFWHVLSDNGNTGLLIEDCEFDMLGSTTGDSCVSGYNYTVRRCNIHGSPDGMKAGTNCVIEDNYIHDLTVFGDSHNDAIQSLGTTSLTIRHNTIVCPSGGTSAIILSTGNATDMRNILIENNLLAGGVYTIYAGYDSGSDDIEKVENIQVLNNHFSTSIFANGGSSGPITSRDAPVVVSGNVWHDGPNIGNPVT